MKQENKMKQTIKKISDSFIGSKKIEVCIIVFFCISLIPILYLSGYVHATGDDYGWCTNAPDLAEYAFCLAGVKNCRTDGTALLGRMAGNLVYHLSDEFAARSVLG